MKLLFLALTFIATYSWGRPGSSCNLPTVKKLTLPVYPDRSHTAKFTFSFQYFPPKRAGAPTVVVIPGGPGVGLIEDWSVKERVSFGVPRDYGFIFLDPRTVGCNEGDERVFPDDALTTEYLAQDILAALKSLRIKNFVLYGHSYGSALATVTAGLAEKKGMRPKALVLTGIIGRWVQGAQGSVYWGLMTEWERLKARLPRNIVDRFVSGDLPFGWSEDTWGDVIENGLYLGRVMRDGVLLNPLHEALRLLSLEEEESDDEALELLSELRVGDKFQKAAPGGKWSQRLFEVIDCAELTDTEPTTALRNGVIVPTGDDCSGRPTLVRPYDARNYPTFAPTFYFSGTAEAVTFYSQAREHFISYTGSDRHLVTILEGSHNRLGEYFPDCLGSLWKSMVGQGKKISTALKGCEIMKLMCAQRACDGSPVMEFLPGKQFTDPTL